jgi:subtilisin family serine protease
MRYPALRRAPLALIALATVLPLSLPATAQDLLGGAGGGISSLTTSVGGPNPPLNGLNINTIVGANRFYAAGYTGTRAVIGNVEAGHIWNGHETLGHVTTFVNGAGGPSQTARTDFHATYVGHILGGRDNGLGNTNLRQGIASGANLWSGAIATSWNNPQVNQLNFTWNTGSAFTTPYDTFLQTGVASQNGRRADVVNSSWGFFSPSQPNGEDQFTMGVDGMARQSRRTVVFSAGNSGPNPDTVDAPGVGFNSLVVGATTGPTSNPVYGSVAPFSSRSPTGYTGPTTSPTTFETVANARARVDIVAPGTNFTVARYGGLTGGNSGAANDPTGGAGTFYTSDSGTSFSAPVVAGGAALLADVAYDRYAANIDNAIDGNVIKAVLLNSADKLTGWTNGLAANGQGVLATTQALDFSQGAGQLNLNRAFDQYTAGDTDLAGTGGGNIQRIGWDWGNVAEDGFNDYNFATSLVAGDTFTATLNWYVKTSFDGLLQSGDLDVSYGSFSNLALEVYRSLGGGNSILIASSDAAYINTEHLFFSVPTTGDYFLRVRWTGERYDFIESESQNYGLAWSVSSASANAPEPGAFVLVGVGLVVFGVRRRFARP